MKCGEYKIDIGCGYIKEKGMLGLDLHDYTDIYPKGEFMQHDLETGVLPFCTDSCIHIQADNVMEHIVNLIPLLNDCHRVLRKDGTLKIIVPKAGSDGSFRDPTHVRFFSDNTFYYFYKGDRAENYGIKPWMEDFYESDAGRIECIMKPDK